MKKNIRFYCCLLFLAGCAAVFPACSPRPGAAGQPVDSGFEKDSSSKVIGMIGGVSWASSEVYYRRMNELMRDRFGSLYSANVLMYSIPFHRFAAEERLAGEGDWNAMTRTIVGAAQRLKAGGADFIIIASNTINALDSVVEAQVGLPVLDIIDAVGEEIVRRGGKKVILLGTKYTMEDDFYRGKLARQYGLTVLVPNAEERDYVNNVIFDELCNNRILDASREGYKRIVERIVREEGADGVILGCTEIPLLIGENAVDIAVYNSTEIHASAAVDYATAK